jgi:hypothetical protein
VKSFLESTTDLAMQQIITNGVPGTAMPAWGTRMAESDIQAIVGFIRQWEPTAPEVASPVRGGGGPPWMRNTSTTGASAVGQGAGTGAGAGTGVGQGQGQHAGQQAPAAVSLDWRLLVGITAILAIAFILILLGYSGIKKVASR